MFKNVNFLIPRFSYFKVLLVLGILIVSGATLPKTSYALGFQLNFTDTGAQFSIPSQGLFDLTATQPNGFDGTKCVAIFRGSFPDDSVLANGGCAGAGNGDEWGSISVFGIGGQYTNGSGLITASIIDNCPTSFCVSSIDSNYWIAFTPFSCGTSGCISATSSDYYYVQPMSLSSGIWSGSFGPIVYPDTRFTETTPLNNEVVSSTTSFLYAAGLNITQNDYSEDEYVTMRFVRNSDLLASVANSDLLWHNFEFRDGVDGNVIFYGFNYFTGTTTPLPPGQYTMEWKLINPSFVNTLASWFNLNNVFGTGSITSTSTQFIVGERGLYDNIVASSSGAFNDLLGSTTISSFQQVKDFCNPLSGFDIQMCLSGMFLPSSSDMSSNFAVIQNNVLNRVPIGYLTRFVVLLNAGSTTTIPSFPIKLPGALSSLSTTTIDFDSALSGASGIMDSIVNPDTGTSVKGMVQTLIQFIVGLSVFMIIFLDVMAKDRRDFSKKSSESKLNKK